jgi:undecaprenyl-diphosphatase
MTFFQSFLLGIVQGITEFVPVSSSGHLVIAPFLLRWEIPDSEAFVFNVLVQVATLSAVFAYFARDLRTITLATLRSIRTKKPFECMEARLGWFILLATIPAGGLGFLMRDQVELVFNNPLFTAIFLLGTAGLLILAERKGKRNRDLDRLTWVDALMIGLFQILAIFPGISRSGATITGGMVRDLDRKTAARFSFLMSIPIMLVAGLLAVYELVNTPGLLNKLPSFIPGFISSGVFGYLAIRWLLAFLSRYPLYVFSIYCGLFSLLTLLVFFSQ